MKTMIYNIKSRDLRLNLENIFLYREGKRRIVQVTMDIEKPVYLMSILLTKLQE